MTGPRLLVVRLGAMGDVLHALPAVASLKTSLPHWRLTWLLEPKWKDLLAGNPFVDEVIFFDRHELASVRDAARRLRQAKFEVAIDFQGLVKSALAAAFAQPDRLYGFCRAAVREWPAAFFYSHAVRPTAQHVVDRNLELAAAAGATNIVKTFSLPQGEDEGKLPDGPFVLANPLAGWASKQWPLERYTELAKMLREECNMPLVLNAAPGQLDGIRGVCVHRSSIAGLIAATRRATAVVGVDSGPMHLAAALGKPGVALFGPTDPARNGPYGGAMAVLRRHDAATSYKRGTEPDASLRALGAREVLVALRNRMTMAR